MRANDAAQPSSWVLPDDPYKYDLLSGSLGAFSFLGTTVVFVPSLVSTSPDLGQNEEAWQPLAPSASLSWRSLLLVVLMLRSSSRRLMILICLLVTRPKSHCNGLVVIARTLLVSVLYVEVLERC